MLNELPKFKGFESRYNEQMDAVIFDSTTTKFTYAYSLLDIINFERLQLLDFVEQSLNDLHDNYLAEQLIGRYKS